MPVTSQQSHRKQYRAVLQKVSSILVILSILISAFALGLPTQSAQAEGTKELVSSGLGKRALTEWRITTTAGLYRRTFLRVYAKAGEYILMGSSAMGLGTADIVLYQEGLVSDSQIAPAALAAITPTYKCSVGGGGYLAGLGVLRGATSVLTRTIELQGATRNGGVDGGYIPCVYTVPAGGTGSYWIAMYGPDGVNGNANGAAGTIAAPVIDATQASGVSVWDITVRSGANPNTGIDKPGRTYVDYLAQISGGNGAANQMDSTFYAITNDGYVYRVDLNGLDPNGYIFYGNRAGFLDPDGKTPLYNDFVTDNNQLDNIQGGVIKAPASVKLFFNNPLLSGDLPASILPTPITPSITNVSYKGSAYNNTGYQTIGGTFTYDGNVGGISEIIISRDGVDFSPDTLTNRRVLSQSALGSNVINWDGKDNQGNYFPVGNYYPFKVIFHAGEYHFPLLDSENSLLGGPTFTMLNPIGGVCPFNTNCHSAFYDDRGYRLSTGTVIGTVGATLPGDANGMNPPAINHSDWSTGFDTSTNQRAYGDGTGNGFGNWKGLNLWTYFPVNVIQEQLNVIASINQDLRIEKTNTGVFTLGNNGGSFSINVDNVGSALVAGLVSVTDPLPASLTPVSATGTGWACSINGQNVSCTNPNAAGLAAGASLPIITITVNVSAAAAPSVTNTASLTNSNDVNPANNQFSDTVIVNVSDLAVTKTDGVASVSAGGNTTYTLVVSNAGPSPADNAVFTDPAVAGLNVTSVKCSSVSGGAACPDGTITTVKLMQGTGLVIPTLPSGGSVTFTVNATVTATSGSVANVANVMPSAISNDPNLVNNTATDTDTVTPAADLSITKTDGAAIVSTGAATTYTIRVTNNGLSSVTGALLSDPAATGLTKTTVACSATPGQCVAAPTVAQLQSGTFALPALAAGQYYEITVAATVTAASGSVTNNASVAAPGGTTDPIPGNNTAADTDTVNPAQCVSGAFASWAFTNNTTPNPVGSGTFAAGSALPAPTYPNPGGNPGTNPVISYTNWPNGFVFLNNNQYLQFSVPTTGKNNIVMSFAHEKNNAAGPTNFYVYYSTDGGVSWTQMTTGISPNTTIVNGTFTSVSIDFSSVPTLNNNANAAFRLYAYGATNAAQPWYVDTVSFSQNCGSANLAVTKTDSITNVAANGTTMYTLTLTNGGPGAANNATISDPAVTGLAKTILGACTAAGGAACPATGGGAGQLNIANLEAGTVSVPTLPSGGSISFSVTATVTAPGGSISNSFTALPPLGTTDSNYANNAAIDIDTVVAINAVDDSGTTINSANGGTSIPNVLVNDTLNGAQATTGNVTITVVGSWPAGVTLNTGTGAVSVAPGTASGTYNPQYRICSQAAPTICSMATVTVPVVAINAVSDSGTTINSVNGGTSIANVLVNDTLNGAAATTSNVFVSTIGSWPTGITLNTSTGAVNVAPGTATGTYTPQYQICSQAYPAVCSTATVTVPVVAIQAVNDSGATINGAVGGTSIANVLVNDTLNGVAATTATVTITVVGSWPAGVTLNTSTGAVSVAPGTASGTYTPQYQICDKAVPTVCSTATATVPVVAINAVNDSGSAISSAAGGTSVANVLVNDTLSGLPATIGNVAITVVGSWPAGVTLNTSTGAVSVAPGTAVGTYTPQYKICDQANPTFCSTATVTVPVVAINAVNDSGSTINGAVGGTSIANVLANDTLNGAAATTSNVTITVVGSWPAGVTLNTSTGVVSVAPGTAAGSYTPQYRICSQAYPAICSTATVTVPVATIQAVNDSGSAISSAAGGTSIANVLVNDTLNGAAATTTTVTITVVGSWPAGVTMNTSTGAVSVAPGTAVGTYSPQYQICDKANPTFCSTATVTVPVVAINAVNDSGATINGAVGGTSIVNVLVNDTLNGAAATIGNVNITVVGSWPAGVTLNTSTGAVSVAPGTAAGSYTPQYRICSQAYPAICSTATVTVPVATIQAVNDSGTTINGAVGGTSIANVLVNDTLNGVAATTATVTITVVGSWPAGVTLNTSTGAVSVAPGTASGTYTPQYQICDKANPTFCSTATVTVPVVTIQAVNDSGATINGAIGGTSIANVLVNDTLSGLPATIGNVTITVVGSWPAGVTLNTSTGAVSVAPGTAAGTYTPQYKICDQANPTFCSTATVTVPVATIQAVNDSGSAISSAAGGTSIANVLVNDTLSGLPATIGNVTITTVGSWPAGVTLNTSTGVVSVAPGTASGTYSPQYQICDKANPTFCSTATVTVPVVAINAVNDSGATINGAVGGTSIANVLVNDTLNGAAATTGNVTITVVGSWPAGVTLNTSTGVVSVAPGTTAGSYTPQYRICSQAYPAVCSTATVTVPVVTINAVNDSGATINGAVGGTSIANVLVNDTLNGAAATTATVTITVVGSWPAGVSLNTSTGAVSVAPGTASGTYTPQYKICDQANPTFCSTATVTVPVVTINAVNDSGATINGAIGGTSIANVLVNDTLSGLPATTGNVTITVVGSWPAGVTLNTSTGAVSVAPGTAAGTYSPQYKICDKANPTFCSTATVTVPVVTIQAVNDSGVTINGAVGGTSIANVLVNDTLNGVAATTTTVTITVVGSWPAGVTLNTSTGAVSVAPGTAAGTYTPQYKICDKANPTFCSTATVTVPVVTINAVNDSGATINGAIGGTSIANVLVNDTLSGLPATIGNVTITVVGSWPAGVTLNTSTGAVSVAPGTAAGTYSPQYKICDKANPTFCSTATVTVPVVTIQAVNDSGVTINGAVGGTSIANVLVNDTLNGAAATTTTVTITVVGSWPAGVTLNTSTGAVSVAPGTASGTYSPQYQICDKANPTFCSTATVTVPVVAINAVNDSGATINGAVGGTSIANVLVNDTLNGAAATTTTVTITVVGSWPAGVTLNTSTGAVSVAPGTASGTYTPQYKICDKANPTFCSTATVTVPVVAINAVNDSGATINGAVGGTSIANVLVNDTLNGAAATTTTVTITVVGSWPAGVTLNTSTGAVSVAPGTASGTYSPQYQICDKANPTFCSTATVTVPVVTINAVNDSGATINGAVGGTSVANVLVNDTLSGLPATIGNVTITVVGSWPAGVTLNTSTGAVSVAPGTAAGTYTPQYKICDKANPTFCSTATVTVPVIVTPTVVSGHLYYDANGNGAQDAGEPNLANVDVLVTDVLLHTQTVSTDGSGNWVATVLPGSTTAEVQTTDPQFTSLVPAGWTQTQGTLTNPVTAVAGANTNAGTDGYYTPATVSGHLYYDANGNGTQDAGEPNLANVDVLVTDSLLHTQTVSTDGSGNWVATVPPGSTTAEVQTTDPQFTAVVLAGWTQTEGTPTNPATAVAGANTNAGNDGYYNPPTAVELTYLNAVPTAPFTIEVRWHTVLETTTVGFNVYRSEQADGPSTRLNAALIPANALGVAGGAAYRFIDTNVKPAVTYYYRLEEISTDLVPSTYGQVSTQNISFYLARVVR